MKIAMDFVNNGTGQTFNSFLRFWTGSWTIHVGDQRFMLG